MTFPDPGRFFIVGCQRSGMTLLRLVLECHPLVACFDEDTAYKALRQGCRRPPPGKRLAGFKIPRWTEQLGEPVCQDEGLAETATEVYRGEPLVFVLRDVRDVVASMHKLKMTERHTWLEFCARPILEAKLRRPEFRQRYAAEIAALHACGDSPFAVGALYWKYKTQPYFDYRERGWPVHAVRYEDLVATPRPELRRLVSFLGLPWFRGLLNHPDFPHAELYANGLAMGNTDPKRPIGANSVGQWRRLLSPEAEAEVMQVAGDLHEYVAELSPARGVRRVLHSIRRAARRLAKTS